jgi:hypothetical protein
LGRHEQWVPFRLFDLFGFSGGHSIIINVEEGAVELQCRTSTGTVSSFRRLRTKEQPKNGKPINQKSGWKTKPRSRDNKYSFIGFSVFRLVGFSAFRLSASRLACLSEHLSATCEVLRHNGG